MAEKEYTRSMSDMRGIDATSDPSTVSPRRFSFIQNMYKDYKSGQGLAVETFPGTRTLADFGGKIYGIHHHKDGNNNIWLVVHAGTNLFRFKMTGRDEITDKTPIFTSMNERRSSSFVNNNRLYIIDGANYLEIDKDGTVKRIMSADGGDQIAYIPTTYSDGKQYEQRNMLTDNFMEKTHITSFENSIDSFLNPQLPEFAFTGILYTSSQFGLPWRVMAQEIDYTEYVGDGRYLIPKHLSIGSITGRVTINSDLLIELHEYEDEDGYYEEYSAGEASDFENGKLESVVFERDVLAISGALKDFPNLRTIKLPDGITKLDDYFFANTSIEEITLPSQLTELGWYAFKDCKNLKTIYASDEEFEDSNGYVSSMYNILRASLMSNNVYSIPEGVEIVKGTAPSSLPPPISSNGENRIYIYTPCKSITKVELDGKKLALLDINATITWSDKYYIPLYHRGYIIAIDIITLNSNDHHNLTINGVAYPSMFKSVTQAFIDSRPIEDMEDKSIYGNHDYEGTTQDAINNCTICTTFDDRIFFTGNPYLPNTVFYTQRDLTGHNNATYIGALNWFDDGVSGEPNVAMMSNATTLMVLKGNTIQDGSIYYHTGADGENDLVPRIYPSVEGLAGLGCVGLAVNFRDDCVFLSRQGLEGISKQTVNLERTIQHRSTNIDGLMLLCGSKLKEAKAAEWEGYLCILVDGKMFLADSRQMFEGIGGAIEYEWYNIDPVGAYTDDNQKYILADWAPEDLKEVLEEKGIEISDAEDRSVVYQNVESFSVSDTATIYYIERDEKKYLVDSYGELEGGKFDPACEICAIDDVLLLGTEGGKLLCVNTDKRGKDGADRDRIPMKWYNNSGHAYDAVAVFAMDNAGVPHYTKTTVKRGTVLRLKSFPRSSFEVHATTDRQPTTLLSKQSNSITTFDEWDFANLGLLTNDSSILAIKEKTKKWVEKQYMIIGREHNEPWGFYSLVYRYNITGEVKNK